MKFYYGSCCTACVAAARADKQLTSAATTNIDELTSNKTWRRPHHITLKNAPSPDDETITLVQFLAECDRTPRSRVGEQFSADHTARNLIRYWHRNSVSLSVRDTVHCG